MMINKTKNKIIVKKTSFCKTILQKAKGLMFSKKLKDKALIFIFNKEKIISLHMLFVFYPIDIIFLDKNKKVIEIKQNFKPFTFYKNRKPAKYIVELPENIIKKTKTKNGDKISF